MRDPKEDFCSGVMAGVACQLLLDQLRATAPRGTPPNVIAAKLLERLEDPRFIPAIREQSQCKLARDVWAAWRKAEQSAGRLRLVGVDEAVPEAEGETKT